MRVGMAVGSWSKQVENREAKLRTLAADLDVASAQAEELNLWVLGQPFSEVLKAVSRQLVEVAESAFEDARSRGGTREQAAEGK